MPMTWLVVGLCWAVLTKYERRRKKILLFLFGSLLILSNPFLANELFLWWEIPATPFLEVKNYEVGIVLTGFAQEGRKPTDRVYLNKAADRVIHTIKLYKEHKIKAILICGAEYQLDIETTPDYRSAREIFIQAGIPDSAIFVEPHSRNTRENALLSKGFLTNKFPNQRYLVITSAFHVRRAKGCFDKVGLKVDTFSVDFTTHNRSWNPIYFIPREDAFAQSSRLFQELLGYCVYKLMGYC